MNDETAGQDPVTVTRHGAVCEIRIDNPPVNALGQTVRAGLEAALERCAADPETRVLLLTASGRLFSAGADIREFDGDMQPPHLPLLINRFEDCDKPVVIALHGTAMGGALELAMGCHYRVAAPGAKLGLPEVKIGIIPGAGGTQRLPRLIGSGPALELITRGKAVPAERALELGLIDAVFESDFRARALDYAVSLAQHDACVRRTRDLDCGPPEEGFEATRAKLEGRPGTGAARACVDAIEAAADQTFSAGMKRENELFTACFNSPEAAALRHVFFAERRAGHIPGLEDTRPRRIRSAAVVGAGTMGTGIAMTLADAGLDVALLDQSRAAAGKGLERIAGQYRKAAERGRMDADECERRTASIRVGADADLAAADLVIEAVFEDLALKKEIFAHLDATCRDGALLATNTSTLDVNAIAAATQRPGDVLGLHFFSPANVMRLLEIVRAERTADDVLASAVALAGRLGKVGVVSGVCDGFIGNRMLEGYLREAGRLLLEGARPDQVDRAVMAWGWAMGPFAVSDLAGIDIGHYVREQRGIDGSQDPCYAVGEALYQAGRYGQKTGAGFYRYQAGDHRPHPDPQVDEVIARESARFGIVRRAVDDGEIIERCLLPLINEGARILEEGVALRASDIDLVWIHGYGFPAFRGGPMYHANARGLAAVLAGIEQYGRNDEQHWKPADALRRLAAQEGVFE